MALSKIDVANMLTGLVPNDNTIRRPLSKPIIINGDQAVAQRSTSASSISTAGYHATDRFRYSNSTSAVVVTISQETLSSGNAFLNGFHNALKLDCTTADTSIAADHLTALQYKIEAQDCTVFRKGTANAKKMTVAFWFKATKTGTYILQIGDSDNNRKISKSYSVSTTNTWEHKVLAFDIETSNAMNDDNGAGFVLTWWLVAGSTYSGGTLATSWEATEFNSNSAVGQVNAFDSTDNNVHITGIQAEVGEFSSTTLPPFQFESFEDNLFRCQRYYQLIAEGAAHNIGISTAYNGTTSYTVVRFPTEMRSDAVSVEQNTGTNYYALLCENSNTGFDNFQINQTRTNMMRISDDDSTGKTQGASGWFECNASGRLAVEDEL
jgi:hypothetical protein